MNYNESQKKETLLDINRFNELTSDHESLKDSLTLKFLEVTPLLLLQLRQATEASNTKMTSNTIHKLKSSASLFCNEAFSLEIAEIERASILVITPDFKSSVNRLTAKIEQLMQEIRVSPLMRANS